MTVGEALAEARYRAGLTVDEVSERTRIREAVIRCIEQDDYDACGGDLYARGYVRAIAGAIGIDAQPLIRDFDARRADAGRADAGRADTSADVRRGYAADPVAAPADPVLATADAGFKAVDPALTIADPGFTLDPGFRLSDSALTIADPGFRLSDQDARFPFADPDQGYMTAEPVYRIADPEFTAGDPAFPAAAPALTAGRNPTIIDPFVISPEQVFSASTPIYGRPANPSAWRGRSHSRRWVTGVLLLVALAATLAIVAGSHIIAGLRHTPAANNSGTVAQQAQPGSNGGQGAGAKNAPGGSKASKAPAKAKTKKPAAKKKAPRPAGAPPVRSLPIALAAAFGPAGTADGDNPQSARFAITPGPPWQTQWYASPEFGMLKHGTGLLLDMGKTATISSVRIGLSPYRGANLQLLAGGSAARLRVVARASDTGGTVRLRLAAPVHARYLLIWFTLLPPNGQGRYQESVHGVVVNGRR